MKRAWVLALAGALSLGLALPVLADDDCPSSVKKAVEKTFPGSHVKKCELETNDGKQMYEVKLKTKEGYTTRMDLDPAGVVLLTQQAVTVEGVPTVVMKTFRTKYPDPDYKVTRTEKWVYPDGKVTYRVTYARDNSQKAVVYTNEGVFIEETEPDLDDMD
jgi:hypothetical protein